MSAVRRICPVTGNGCECRPPNCVLRDDVGLTRPPPSAEERGRTGVSDKVPGTKKETP